MSMDNVKGPKGISFYKCPSKYSCNCEVWHSLHTAHNSFFLHLESNTSYSFGLLVIRTLSRTFSLPSHHMHAQKLISLYLVNPINDFNTRLCNFLAVYAMSWLPLQQQAITEHKRLSAWWKSVIGGRKKPVSGGFHVTQSCSPPTGIFK